MSVISKIQNIIYERHYSILKRRWDDFAKKSKLRIYVIMYHHVTDDEIDDTPQCICNIETFRDTLKKLKKNNYSFIKSEDIPTVLKTKEEGNYVVITFDDVPDDFYLNAYPLLKEMGIPFTLFITTNFVDKEGFLSKEQILEMDNDDLCTIGAHTVSHPQLRKSIDVSGELTESKKILEEFLKHNVEVLAYPYGRPSSVSKKVMNEACKAGYKMAFGTVQSVLTKQIKNQYYLPRIVINQQVNEFE